MIDALINKLDNFEIIRDQIAAILTLETASQQNLATVASLDPDDYKFQVFVERANPWEKWLNDYADKDKAETCPIVSVWYDSSTFDPGASNMVDRQKADVIYNIDCYGYGVSAELPDDGHMPGDLQAALEAQRALRLVRNILMSANYRYLGLQGLVWDRWTVSTSMFQLDIDAQRVQKIVAGRLSFKVTFSEFAPQITPLDLEYLSVDITRASDGMLYAEADYDLT